MPVDPKQRLLSMRTDEVSMVDVPANETPFAVVKSQELPMTTPAGTVSETAAPAAAPAVATAAPAVAAPVVAPAPAPVAKADEAAGMWKSLASLAAAVKAFGCAGEDKEKRKALADGVKKAIGDVRKAGNMDPAQQSFFKDQIDPMAFLEFFNPDGSSAGADRGDMPLTPQLGALPTAPPPADLAKQLAKQLEPVTKQLEDVVKRLGVIESVTGKSQALPAAGTDTTTNTEKAKGFWDGAL